MELQLNLVCEHPSNAFLNRDHICPSSSQSIDGEDMRHRPFASTTSMIAALQSWEPPLDNSVLYLTTTLLKILKSDSCETSKVNSVDASLNFPSRLSSSSNTLPDKLGNQHQYSTVTKSYSAHQKADTGHQPRLQRTASFSSTGVQSAIFHVIFYKRCSAQLI